MYLHYFEEAVRSVLDVSDPPFAMPYWDYGHKDAQGRFDQLKIPADFLQARLPNGQANDLYFSERNDDAVNIGLPPREVDTRVIFQQAQLLTGGTVGDGFNGRVNHRPHGVIHGVIGKPTGMASFEYAARDPLFWVHHANIDRFWQSWRQPRVDGASVRDPTNGGWLAQEFAFPDSKTERSVLKVLEALNLSTKMRVGYDRLEEGSFLLAAGPEPSRTGPRTTLSESSSQSQPQITEKNVPVGVTVPPTVPTNVLTGFTSRTDARFFLVIEVETASAPGGIYEVYARVPSAEGTTEQFLESFDLFGPEGGGNRSVTWTADVTAFVRQNHIDITKPLDIVFRAQYAKPAVPVKIKKVTIRAL
jgi:tyrosinase